MQVIADLNKNLGITMILVEHRLDIASKFATRVMIMDDGRIVLDGPPSQVYGEQARLIGIGLPKVTSLFNLLDKDGIRFPRIPISADEAATELRKMLSR